MRTVRRIALGLVVLVVVLGAVGYFLWPRLLETAWGRATVASRLTDSLGIPVEVDSLDTGSGSVTVGLKLGELARVEALTANASVADLAAGKQPTELTARGLTLTLHLSADGKLLTPVPTGGNGGGDKPTIPAVRVEGGTVRVQQDGKPEFVLSNLSATFDPATGALAGTVADPGWGNWTLAGTIDTATGSLHIELATAGADATMDRLRSIPYCPPTVWDHVRPTGQTAAKVTLDNKPGETFAFAVDLGVKSARVELPDLGATILETAGTVRIVGPVVTLADCNGKLAGGGVRAGGTLDFGPDPATLKLAVNADGWDVKQLPPAWELPQEFGGRLRGAADLDIRVFDDGRFEPRATGGGAIEGATLSGIPLEVKLTLHGDGNRLRFGRDAQSGTPRKSRRQAQPPPAPPAAKEPTTLDAEITLRDVDLAELLQKLDVKVPYKLGGKVTVVATLSVPLGTADKRRSYRLRGKFTSPALTLEGLTLSNVAADLRFTDGTLTLRALEAGFPGGGTARGTAGVGVDPPGELSTQLMLAAVPLGEALKAIPGVTPDIRGTVDGKVAFRGPWEKLADAATWTGSADLTTKELAVYGRTVRDVKATAKLAAGTLTVADAAATIEGLPATGTGTLGLKAPYRFAATVDVKPAGSDLRKLAPELGLPFTAEGTLTATAKVAGTLSPAAFTASGTAGGSDLKLGGVDGNKLVFKWELTRDRVKVTDLDATLFRGTLAGTADVPFDRAKAAAFDLKFTDLDLGPASKSIPDLPVRLEGRATGKLVGTVPAAEAGKPRAANLDIDLASPKLTVQGIPTEKLTGKLTAVDGKVQYHLDGKTLGGSFELKGTYPGKERGSLKIDNVSLRRLATDAGFRALGELGGRVDVTFDFAGDFSEGTGRAQVRGLRWGQSRLSPELVSAIRLTDGVLELVDLNGPLAGGVAHARGRVYLDAPDRNFLAVTVERADAKALFAPVPQLADAVDGPVTVTARGRFGREARVDGSVYLPRGTVFGLGLTEVRLPFDVSAARGGGEFAVREGAGFGGGGRLVAQANYRWGLENRLTGEIKFTDARLNAVVADLGSTGGLGQGRVTGRFTFGGTNVLSENDLTGSLSAKINEASVREIPILKLVTPYLSPAGLTTPFQSGEVEARLARGVFRVQRLALGGPTIQLFAEGTVGLNGRLDLDVVGQTGQIGAGGPALRALGLRLPAFGPIPLTLIRDISEFLSNRTVRLHVTGTTASPQVQVNAAALLTDQAIRFILGRYGVDPNNPFQR